MLKAAKSLAIRRERIHACRESSSMAMNGVGLLRAESCVAFVSASSDIFTNLALEDWIYRNWAHDGGLGRFRRLLMLWRNSPCAVIGRHQNPWLECRLSALRRHGAALARRNSGGGTVYHDLGNLNCTFFTSRSEYDRKDNLLSVCRALNDGWPSLDVGVSPREDILLDGAFKISGTAAKLGRDSAYHHCTVLFDVNKRRLASVLKHGHEIEGLESKATKSVSSPVKNLAEVVSSVHFEALVQAIGSEFHRRYGIGALSIPLVDPTEEAFTGLTSIRENLMSWDWIFGKSPSLKLRVQLTLPEKWQSVGSSESIHLTMSINRGLVEELSFEPARWMSECSRTTLKKLVGTKFSTGGQLVVDDWQRCEDSSGEVDGTHVRHWDEKRFIREAIETCVAKLL